ncbi:AAA family ATPase [Paraburkholderia sp. BR10936]|uniref:AAA family ATPase n=1 Tax=Paraburkholderia sp. BR10936 TaxID=3236993 RepID=UPI0034D2B6E0
MTVPYNDIAFPNDAAKRVLDALVTGLVKFPNGTKTGILLHGESGNGKSAVAEAIPAEMQKHLDPSVTPYVVKHHVKSPNNGVALIQSLENNFMTWPLGSYHYCVLNEIDQLAPAAMPQFKSLMDQVQGSVVWIFTTNHIDKLDKPLVGRCHVIDYNPSSPNVWVPHARQLLLNRGFDLSDAEILRDIVIPAGNNIRNVVAQVDFYAAVSTPSSSVTVATAPQVAVVAAPQSVATANSQVKQLALKMLDGMSAEQVAKKLAIPVVTIDKWEQEAA